MNAKNSYLYLIKFIRTKMLGCQQFWEGRFRVKGHGLERALEHPGTQSPGIRTKNTRKPVFIIHYINYPSIRY